MKIVVDAMGCDLGPKAAAGGAVLAVNELDCEVILVGDELLINAELKAQNYQGGRISVVHAPDVIEVEEKATAAIRKKKDSSMSMAFALVEEGKGDAIVSAGSTGAILSGATFVLKRIKGVRRAAIATIMPTKAGSVVLLDSGANTECTPEQLIQFAHMGNAYSKLQIGVPRPRVALLNIGTEPTKGGDVLKETYKQLTALGNEGKFNFIGNIEARDVTMGKADVVVCDGFAGNILLKSFEGVALYLLGQMKEIFSKNTRTKLAALTMKDDFIAFKKSVDYKEVGGAPLLGIAKPVIKAHGSSDATAFKNAIRQAVLYTRSGTIANIESSVAKTLGGIFDK